MSLELAKIGLPNRIAIVLMVKDAIFLYTTGGDMMNIKEVIVVEGKHDTATLQQYFEVDTIETGGSALSQETLATIASIQKKRGVIVFTDPDYPGNKIRNTINAAVDGCKNAYLPQEKARGKHKIGIEHATKEDLWEALSHQITFDKQFKSDLVLADLVNFGLSGQPASAANRKLVCEYFHIAPCNAKALCKQLQMMRVNLNELKQVLAEIESSTISKQ